MPSRVLILPDRSLAQRERTLLERLEIGLADEGVRVAHALPASLAPMSVGGVYSTVVHYQDAWAPGLGPVKARALIDLLEEASPPERDKNLIDVVHCFGQGSWSLGRLVGEMTGAAVVLEVHDAASTPAAAQLAVKPGNGVHAVSLADDALAKLCKPSPMIRLAPWGVYTPEQPVSQLSPPDRLEVVALLGSGATERPIFAAVKALCDFARKMPEDHRPMILVDAGLADRCRIYRWLGQLGFAGRLCEVADLEGKRDVLAESDVLLLPEALGEQRSSVLEAMAAGTIVVAAADKHNGTLIEGVTCRLVGGSSVSDWQPVLDGILLDQPRRAALSESSSKWVASQRSASSHVRETLVTYREAIAVKAAESKAGQRAAV
jgi:glycosyltransferase involved in cell wall biosynthesis